MDKVEEYVRAHPVEYANLALDNITHFGSNLRWACEELGLNEEYAALIAAAKVIRKHAK